MKNSTLTQVIRTAIFAVMLGLLGYLINRDNEQQSQINYNIWRDSTYYVRSDSMLNEIYQLAVGNRLEINNLKAQDKAVKAETADK